FPQSYIVNTAATDSDGFRGVLRYLYRLPRLAPYSVSKFTHPAVRKAVVHRLSGGQFDVAICDFLAASSSLTGPWWPDSLPKCCKGSHRVFLSGRAPTTRYRSTANGFFRWQPEFDRQAVGCAIVWVNNPRPSHRRTNSVVICKNQVSMVNSLHHEGN